MQPSEWLYVIAHEFDAAIAVVYLAASHDHAVLFPCLGIFLKDVGKYHNLYLGGEVFYPRKDHWPAGLGDYFLCFGDHSAYLDRARSVY